MTPWLPLQERFDTEADLAVAILAILQPDFAIHREVEGTHCAGQSLRLDAVLQPIDSNSWRDPDPAIGVEFKNPYQLDSTRDYTSWAAQCVDYTHTAWNGYGRLTVFTCPPITGYSPYADKLQLGFVQRLLGQMNVGELGLTIHGWTLQLNGEAIWSQRKGVHRRWSLIPKVGSR